ncbi:MAG TPA: NAD-glutamate dehydrogenase [Solirubrobacteraceae bacterium]|nr:NAD-glutamate dehydrogenase [Solirubrobacteraceae bacterium]
MAVKAGDLELELIDELAACVRERLPDEPEIAYAEFVRQYFHWVPAADLSGRSPRDLCGALVAHWRTARRRPRPREPEVRVYSPEPERDGWSSPFTVVEIVSDDMPFLVDSVTMELSRQGYSIELIIHPVMRVVRDHGGELIEVLEPGATTAEMRVESIIHAEVGRESDPDRLAVLHAGVELVLEEVRAAVEDWSSMRARAAALAAELAGAPSVCAAHEVSEARDFLEWLRDDHFTFLGYREYDVDGAEIRVIPGSGLGILRGSTTSPVKSLAGKRARLAQQRRPLVLTKANSRSSVHRPVDLDYVGVRRFSPDGRVIGERRFLGLYTTSAIKSSPREIPMLRGKVDRVLTRAAFPPDSHDAKGLIDILESLPRDLLVQISGEDLFEMAIGILGLGERQRVRLFVSRDLLDRFVACVLCLPRDRFNTENRNRAGRILAEAFGGERVDWSPQITESVLVRVNYVVHCPGGVRDDVDVAAVEARIVAATRAWADDLRVALLEALGDEAGPEAFGRYRAAFPAAYRADWSASEAVLDIARIGALRENGRPVLTLYRAHGSDVGARVRAKLLSTSPVLLSDVLPVFEHLGAKVSDEHPYEITPAGADPVWLYDFGLTGVGEKLNAAGAGFAETFLGVRSGDLEDDGLNALVLAGGLSGREITIVRAIARYLRQAAIAFSDAYMERTLVAHPDIAVLLVRLFAARFDPDTRDEARAAEISAQLGAAIDAVASLDEDRILRSFDSVLRAMVRTNYFRRGPDGRPPAHLSFKLDPTELALLPLPRPRYEIFVYSPRVEGVHLRGGRVARGGLRWSDRREDFRTEVLGLMKAQMVKNALIVPVGSKGGFVVKRPPVGAGREAIQAEGIACYETFLRGLLDLTDNYEAGGAVRPPDRVVRYDADDPYLVVAADKGTASFSDVANAISAEYDFWLGDAFASGGSHGYDHKTMGITARGAWESVKRHFRELGTDVQAEEFTAVGIGDMSGDVFGNGMLCSRHVRLIAAFNHQHVFLDPDPDPAVSYAERQRLFELPRSSWSDYDAALISPGGGVHARTLKSIALTPQVRAALAVEADRLAPDELIAAILRAPVDLLFNGGIGTYVKAAGESHGDAGDKANDSVRVDGASLRCRVVGEGGNLGFTQRGRIEYALDGGPGGHGGQINTDAIDNVAGVNCSDHEVNIKILLADVVAAGRMRGEERNRLLASMTDAVAERVLYGSYIQTQALSIAGAQAVSMLGVHERLIRALEAGAGLDRALEALPTEAQIAGRRSARRGLVAPELATLVAHTKIHLNAALLDSDLPEDPYLGHDLERYFPDPLPERFRAEIHGHRLRREIIATVVANQLVDRAGTTFAFRLTEETGAAVPQLARAFAVAREVFAMREFWSEVQALDNHVEAGTQLAMLIEARRLVERATRWLVRAYPHGLGIQATTERFAPGARQLAAVLPGVLRGQDRETFAERRDELQEAGVPDPLARRVAGLQALLSVFDITEDAAATGRDQQIVTEVYFSLGAGLGLDWLRDRILDLPRADRWQALARAALRDDLYRLHRALTREVLLAAGPGDGAQAAIERWRQGNGAIIDRAATVLAEVKASGSYDTTTLPVALRELGNLVSAGAISPVQMT